ncbi:MAG: DUF4411 family protein [Planctomycetes bacterium]|nr:DUF4411 family protein [Planctomycetota bacterium]
MEKVLINMSVVTHERSARRSRKIKTPDVCDKFGVQCTSTFDMLQRLGVVFNWSAS